MNDRLKPETIEECQSNREVMGYATDYLDYVTKIIDEMADCDDTGRRQRASGLANMLEFPIKALFVLRERLQMIHAGDTDVEPTRQ
jgi:hypothetical protein